MKDLFICLYVYLFVDFCSFMFFFVLFMFLVAFFTFNITDKSQIRVRLFELFD